MKLIALIIVSATLLVACENDSSLLDSNQVEKYITASVGGELALSDSIILTIPAGSLPTDGIVFLGITGSEPTTMPNQNMQLIGSPVTVRIPSESLLKPIFLEFTKPANFDTIRTSIWGYNGSTYFPFNYSITDDKLIVTIDIIGWGPSSLKSAAVPYVSEFIIDKSFSKQFPSVEQLGLKRVSVNNDLQLTFLPPTEKPASKVLLLVHGWTGDASTWDVFLSKIQANSDLNYSEIWSFVYISAYSIQANAKLLKEALKDYAKERQVDIVAHSMGGLVARSMIEQYDGSEYVNTLVTLGTPHEGSPFAVFRDLLASYVEDEDIIQYNTNTQGFLDLNVGSNFLVSLNQTGSPKVPYFTIASVNAPDDPSNNLLEKFFSQLASQLLEGDDDGIVQVSSALAIEEATSPRTPILINTAWAHIAMPDNEDVFNQVLAYLQEETSSSGTIQDVDGNTYSTVKIGSQTWMAKNLKTTKFNDGTPIQLVTSNSVWANMTTPAYCWYNNDEATNKNTYGALFNWYAVNTGKLCPTGWHVPSHQEFTTLRDYLGGEALAGGKLKEEGFAHWKLPNTGATNTSLFTAVPSGTRTGYDGPFFYLGEDGHYWSSTSYSIGTAYHWYTYYNTASFQSGNTLKDTGYAIRCVKN